MELVTDANGEPARQLNDVAFAVEKTRIHHNTLMMRVVRMLCAGVVDGDLS
jgi:RIO kinase 1